MPIKFIMKELSEMAAIGESFRKKLKFKNLKNYQFY